MFLARFLKRIASDDAGVTIVEYGLLIALIGILLVSVIHGLGGKTSANIDSPARHLQNAR